MLKLEHDHDWPFVVANHPKDLNDWGIALTKGRTTALVLLSITEMILRIR